MNRKTKDLFEKAVVLAIVAVFIGSAFMPAVSSQSKNIQDVDSSEIIKIGAEESVSSSAPNDSIDFWNVGNTVLSMFTQTIVGLVNIVANTVVSGIRDVFTNEDTSHDRVNVDSSTNQIEDNQLTIDKQEIDHSVNNPDDPSPLDVGDPWWNPGWSYRKEITINHSKVDDDLVNFPVLINITDDDLKDDAQDNGDDIAFLDQSENQLNHEIEYYDNVTGELVAWVNIPSLSSDEDTVLYMYYGNSTCSSQENVAGVWDSNYVMVQHLNETSGTHYDSTSYGNDGTPQNGVTQDATGMVDGADGFDGSDDFVDVPHDSSLDGMSSITLSAWIYPTGWGQNGYGRVICKYGVYDLFLSQSANGIKADFYGVGGSGSLLASSCITLDEWSCVVATNDGTDITVYVDGVEKASSTKNTGDIKSINVNVSLGRRGDNNRWFDGIIDEVRILDMVRSAEWVSTEYNNQKDPSTFYSVGSEEVIPDEPVLSDPSPQDGATYVDVNPTLSICVTDYQGDDVALEWWSNSSSNWVKFADNASTTCNQTFSQIPVNFSLYNTTYYWSVNATDNTHWTNKTFRFTTKPTPAEWWNYYWQYRKLIRIDHVKVDANLTNFPVLINISDDDLKVDAQSDGDDIVFTDGSGSQLSHEIELFNDTSGELVAWVNIPSLSSDEDTVLYMYYGHPTVTSQENVAGVWGSNYVMVQHLNETSGTHYDSTSYSNDGTPQNGVTQDATGQVDGADSFDGSDDYVDVPHDSSLDGMSNITLSAWIYPNGWGQNGYGRIISKTGALGYVYELTLWQPENGVRGDFYGINNIAGVTASSSINLDEWSYVVATNDGTDVTVYVDGVEEASSTGNTGDIKSLNVNVSLGRRGDNNRWFDGIIDEVRILDMVRSAEWVSTEYSNQEDPSTFYSVGSEEVVVIPEEPVLSDPWPEDGATDIVLNPVLSINVTDWQGDDVALEWWSNSSGNWVKFADNASTTCNQTFSQVPVNFSSYDTIYYWSVNATDGIYWTKETFSFTTKPTPAEWWDYYWQYRKRIVIDHSKVDADLTNFPVLINISDDDLKVDAQYDGDDIVFTDEYDNQLDHEIEYYNHTTGEIVCWVNVISLSSSSDTVLYMYYGNPSASNQQNPIGVWGSSFMMVQHLNETSGTHHDSTVNDNDGTPRGGVNQSAVGQVDGADGFDGSDDFVDVPHDSSLDGMSDITMSAWIHPTGWGQSNYGRVICKNVVYDLFLQVNSVVADFYGVDNSVHVIASSCIALDEWSYVVVTNDGTDVTVYVDGVEEASSTANTGDIKSADVNVSVGCRNGNDRWFDGIIDEVRILDTVRSAEWVSTEYSNQEDPSTFYSVGSEEVVVIPEEPVLSDPWPEDGATDIVLNPVLSINVTDWQGDDVALEWWSNSSGNWVKFADNASTTCNQTFSQVPVNFSSYDTIYYWSVNATDPLGSGNWTNKTYSFTTRPENYAPIVSNPSPADGATVPHLLLQLRFNLTDLDGDFMNYSVETSPDIGHDYRTHNGDGMYTVSVSNVSYPVNYTWYVNVTDGTTWTNVTYQFTTFRSNFVEYLGPYFCNGYGYVGRSCHDNDVFYVTWQAYEPGTQDESVFYAEFDRAQGWTTRFDPVCNWSQEDTHNGHPFWGYWDDKYHLIYCESPEGGQAPSYFSMINSSTWSGFHAIQAENIEYHVTEEIGNRPHGSCYAFNNSYAWVIGNKGNMNEPRPVTYWRWSKEKGWDSTGTSIPSTIPGSTSWKTGMSLLPVNRTTFYMYYKNYSSSHVIQYVKSTDGGNTWGDEHKCTELDAITGCHPSFARYGDNFYIFLTEPDVVCYYSTDGEHWTNKTEIWGRGSTTAHGYMLSQDALLWTASPSGEQWGGVHYIPEMISYPREPTDPTPANSSTVVNSEYTAQLTTVVHGNQTYDVAFYWANGTFIGEDKLLQEGDIARVEATGLSDGETYEWYAIARGTTYSYWGNEPDPTSDENRSEIWSFIYKLPQEPQIFNESPQDGAVDVPVSLPKFSFNLTDYQGNLMNYTIETSPNIGNGSGNNKTNGTYAISVTKNLDYGSDYTWYINVTDGMYWTNKTFTFTAESGIVLSDPVPEDNGEWVSLNPLLSINVSHKIGNLMNITLRTNAGGSWHYIDNYYNVGNGTYSQTPMQMLHRDTTYYWSVNVTDGHVWENQTYSFDMVYYVGDRVTSLGTSHCNKFGYIRPIKGKGNFVENHVHSPGGEWALYNIDQGWVKTHQRLFSGSEYVHHAFWGYWNNAYHALDDQHTPIWMVSSPTWEGFQFLDAATDRENIAYPNSGNLIGSTYTFNESSAWIVDQDLEGGDWVIKYFPWNKESGWDSSGVPINETKTSSRLCVPALMQYNCTTWYIYYVHSWWGDESIRYVKTTDAGQTWSDVHICSDLPDCHGRTRTSFARYGNNFYIFLDGGYPVVYKSTDMENWTDKTYVSTTIYGNLHHGCLLHQSALISTIGDGSQYLDDQYGFITVVPEMLAYPGKPSDPYPANGTMYDAKTTSTYLNVTVHGDQVYDVAFYWANGIFIGEDKLLEEGDVASVQVSGLSCATTYKWYAINRGTTGEYCGNEPLTTSDENRSETWMFTIKPPNEPQISDEQPTNGSVGICVNPTLQATITDYQGDTVEWWIRSNASGMWAAINNGTLLDGNGTVTAISSNMTGSETIYWWSVNVTDPSGSGNWTNKTYAFTTEKGRPVISNEQPSNGAENQPLNPLLSIRVEDMQGDNMDILFRTNASSSWKDVGSNSSQPNGTYYQKTTSFNNYLTRYWWSVNCTDGMYWTNRTYSFTTERGSPLITTESPESGLLGVDLNPTLQANINDSQDDSVDWWIMTNATGPWTTLSNGILPSGTGSISAASSNMNNYNTTYWWSVNCTDGMFWTNETYYFTTKAAPGPWWNESWLYRKLITIGHTQVKDNLVNFPVCIDISDSDLISHAQDDADDIVFTDYSGNRRHHEIERYNNSKGHLVAWVRLPSLSSNTNKILYMYYGNNTCGSQENISGVWGSNYVMVQHLNETSGTHYDSTQFANDGTPSGGLDQDAAGKIDGADRFNGIDAHVNVSDDPTLDWEEGEEFTYTMWIKSDLFSDYKAIATHRDSGSGAVVGLWLLNDDLYTYTSNDNRTSTAQGTAGVTLFADTWYYVSLTRNATGAVDIWLNGTSFNIGTCTGNITPAESLYIGKHSGGQYFYGKIDEIQISNIKRSNGWIQTSFNNQNNPSAFHFVGDEELNVDEPIISDEQPTDNSRDMSLNPLLQATITDYQEDTVNWWIMSNSSGSWTEVGSGTLPVGNGMVSAVPTTMDNYDTRYWWSVNATDGAYWTNQTYMFKTKILPGPWWNSGWLYRMMILFNHTLVDASSNLTNFPVLINLTDVKLSTHAQFDGDDIVFTDYNGNQLAHEIEFYNGNTGELVTWVNVTALSGDEDTKLYMYYGNLNCSNQESIHDVWDSNYRMVQHLPHNWIPYEGNPVSAPGTAMCWHSVFKVNDTYYAYYATGGHIDRATSPDGKNWAEDTANNPVMLPADSGWADSLNVPWTWYESDTYYILYYASGSIGLATSPDGINWTKYPNNTDPQPVITDAEPWGVMKVNDTYYEYYVDNGCVGGRCVALATSTDLVNWTKDPNNPIFSLGATDPDIYGQYNSDVFKYASYYYIAIPGYTYGTNYGAIRIWRDTSPTFYPSDREYLGLVKPVTHSGWDSHDQDTTAVLTDTVYRDSFDASGGELWTYFAAEPGEVDGAWGDTGLLISPSIPQALKGAMRDSTIYNNHGDGAGVGGPVPQFSIIGGGYNFDGQDEYMEVEDSSSLDINDEISMETWIQLDSSLSLQPNNNSGILTKKETNSGYGLWLNSTNEELIVSLGSNDINVDVSSVDWTQWHHLIVTYNGSTINVYIDSSLVHSETVSGAIGTNDAKLWIGDLVHDSGNILDGDIDEVRISDMVRSWNWINTSYNNQIDPNAFYTLGGEDVAVAPIISNENPPNNAVNVSPSLAELNFTLMDMQNDPMNYTIETSPSIGNASANNVPNGTYTVSISGLDFNTTYTWYVNVTDGTHWTRKTYCFTTKSGKPVISDESPEDGSVGVDLNPALQATITDYEGDTVNWSIQSNVTATWQTINNGSLPVGNGTISATPTNMNNYNTTYWWSVNCTDGHNWVNDTFHFTTKLPPAPWWDNHWEYRKTLTLNASMIDADLSNFPVLIDLTDTNLTDHAQSDGDDIVFTDGSGNQLSHEIELFNDTSGELVAWVNIPSLSSDEDTVLYMYYGNSTCNSQENISGVWGSNYVMVQHLNETSGTHYDSTSYGNDGTPQNGVTQDATGQVDGADSFDGSDDYVDCGNSSSLDITGNQITVGAWIKPDTLISHSIVDKDVTNSWILYQTSSSLRAYIKTDGTSCNNPASGTLTTDWNHVAMSYDGSANTLYINGVIAGSPFSGNGNIAHTDTAVKIGYWTSGMFDGIIDEVRISNVARNASWINTSYQNQKDPTQFYSVGSEETAPAGDTTPPEITDVDAVPDPQEVGEYVNITCDVSDNVGVDEVWVNITYPDNSEHNETMQGSYYYNDTYTQVGIYDYFIWANDTSGNANTSTIYHFEIKRLYNISVNTSWNLISIPCYEDIDKIDIIVRNDSIDYTWADAVSEGIILDYIYEWNTTTGYVGTSTLEPGLGYWMWAYYDCELLIPSNVVGTGDITDLELQWNIMGLPYETSLDKEDLIVHYDGDDYTWENATSSNNPTGGPIILGFIYGWDRTNQIYMLSNDFDPGCGYWMYAYYDCILKKEGT